jgi:spermidine synthase
LAPPGLPLTRTLVISAFGASFIALALQIWSIRLLSNLIWDQFAATIVAGGLAGSAIGAVVAGIRHRRTTNLAAVRMDRGFLLLGLAQFGFWWLLTHVEFEPFRAILLHEFRSLLELGALWGTILLMSAICGWLLAHSLVLSGNRLRTVYSADLLGGCVGVCAAVLIGGWIGPLEGILLCATAAVLWSECLRARAAQTQRTLVRWLLSGAVLTLAALLFGRGDLHFPEGKLLHGLEPYVERTVWDPAVRIDVLNLAEGNFFGAGGIANPQPEDEIQFRIVVQDGGAPTAILGLAAGDVEERTLWPKYLQAAPFCILEQPRVLILGPGGGLEVAISAHFDAASIECVEINSSLIELCQEVYKEFQSDLFGRPEVSVQWADARHFLARTRNEYDLILMCGVDSFSAGPGGASAAVENYLYTIEAAEAMLARLSENGVLAVTRRLLNPERESLRFVATLVEALERRGQVDPSSSLCVLQGPATGSGVSWAMMMTKPAGFNGVDRQRIRSWAADQSHRMLFGDPSKSPTSFDQLIHSNQAERIAFLANYPFDIQPVSDDRPYFFQTARTRQLWGDTAKLMRGRGMPEVLDGSGTPLSVGVLTTFAMAVLLLVVACVVLGTFWLRTPRGAGNAVGLAGLYFALTGLGTLLGEIGLFQLGAFLLGMPFLAVGIVLASVLLGAGIGARWCTGSARTVAAAGVLLLLATMTWVSKLAWDWPPPGLPIGALLLAAVSAGFGYLTGSFFPTGLRELPGLQSPGPCALAFAVSSAFAVAGAAAGPVVAIAWGTRALLGSSALILLGAALVLGRSQARSHRGSGKRSSSR